MRDECSKCIPRLMHSLPPSFWDTLPDQHQEPHGGSPGFLIHPGYPYHSRNSNVKDEDDSDREAKAHEPLLQGKLKDSEEKEGKGISDPTTYHLSFDPYMEMWIIRLGPWDRMTRKGWWNASSAPIQMPMDGYRMRMEILAFMISTGGGWRWRVFTGLEGLEGKDCFPWVMI